MKTIWSTFLAGIIFFASCNNPGQTNRMNSTGIPYLVELEKNVTNVKSVPLSSLGKKLEYIPLETNPQSILRGISKIAFSNSFIFISDGRNLLQFDKLGRFIRKIGSEGRGPLEYIRVFDFSVSEEKQSICLLSEKKILEFGFNGHFISSSNLPFLSLHFIFDSKNLMFYIANVPMRTNDSVFSWIVTDLKAEPILKLKNHHKRVNGSGGIWESPLYVFNDKAHFMEYGSDTIFILKEKLREPYALINLGGMKMDPDPKLTLNTRETIDRLNKKLWIRVINENFRYLFMTSWWGFTDSTNYCIFNKQTLETTFISKDGFFNDLDGVVSFWPKYIYKDSILVDYIDAFKLLSIMDKRQSVATKENGGNTSDQLGLLCKQLDKTSNPVLIVLNE